MLNTLFYLKKKKFIYKKHIIINTKNESHTIFELHNYKVSRQRILFGSIYPNFPQKTFMFLGQFTHNTFLHLKALDAE